MEIVDRSSMDFSLTRGGPLFSILRSSKLFSSSPEQRFAPALLFIAVTWAPMMLLGIAHWLRTRTADPFLGDPAIHARLLLAIPLFFVAEAILEERCSFSFHHVVECYARRKTAAAPIAEKAEHLRDSRMAEAILLAIGIVLGQFALWGITNTSGALRGIGGRPTTSDAFAWYALIALPLFDFLLLRLLYRWAIWSWMVVKLSRIDLDLLPTHPDLAGGLAELSEPVMPFAVIAFAASSVVGSTWAYRVAVQNLEPKAFASPFLVLVAIVMLLAFGPLLSFSLCLLQTRVIGLRQYSVLALRYTKRFHERWIVEADDAALLGSADIQALNDLGQSFHSLERMRIVPFSPRLPLVVLTATFAPMLPVLAMKKPIPELATSLARALLGGGFGH